MEGINRSHPKSYPMIFWFGAIAVVIVLIYFTYTRRQAEEVWQRFRKRKVERLRGLPSDEPDAHFQFDEPNKPKDPN
jgi:hypothetical protein